MSAPGAERGWPDAFFCTAVALLCFLTGVAWEQWRDELAATPPCPGIELVTSAGGTFCADSAIAAAIDTTGAD